MHREKSKKKGRFTAFFSPFPVKKMLHSPFNHVNKWLLPGLGRPLTWIERFQGKNKLPRRVAQWESATFTWWMSWVQSPPRLPR